MPDSEMAPGEIARSLARLERGLESLGEVIKNLDVIHRAEYEAHRSGDEKRMVAIEEDVAEIVTDIKANRRIAFTSLVAPILILVFGAIFAAVMTG